MSLPRPTIKDARDRRVPVVVPGLDHHGPSNPEIRDRLIIAAPITALSRAEKRRATLITVGYMLPLLALGAVVAWIFHVGIWWIVVLPFVMGPLTALGTLAIARRAMPQRIADTYVRAGLCGSCGYDLRDIPVDATGTTTCPECGAAWNLAQTADRLAREENRT